MNWDYDYIRICEIEKYVISKNRWIKTGSKWKKKNRMSINLSLNLIEIVSITINKFMVSMNESEWRLETIVY